MSRKQCRVSFQNCSICGKLFQSRWRTSAHAIHDHKTCHDCNHWAANPKGFQKGHIPWNKGKKGLQVSLRKGQRNYVRKNCKICGHFFWVWPSDAKKITCCSPACKAESTRCTHTGKHVKLSTRQKLSQARTGKPNYKLRKALLPPKICEHCGQSFRLSRKSGKQYREDRRFCSSDCWYEYIRDDPNNHPCFKGGCIPYYGPNWEEQACKVRKCDNNTCQHCGKQYKKRRMDVHHIVPFREFGIERYKEANRLTNLTSLCKRCHKLAEAGVIPIQLLLL